MVFSQYMFPVGTIIPYAGDLSKIPYGWHVCDGTNDTPDLSDRFLEGTTAKPKMFKNAGLPNITASFAAYDNGSGQGSGFGDIYNYGAIHQSNSFYAVLSPIKESFSLTGHTKDEVIKMASSIDMSNGIYQLEAESWSNFNASWSSLIYGNSDTVQPKSYTVYYIMRVK